MEPLSRVIRYVDLGFSVERIAELMEWPIADVCAVKGAWYPLGRKSHPAVSAWHKAFKDKHGCSYSTFRYRQRKADHSTARSA